eukprot:Rmarinus@m.1328
MMATSPQGTSPMSDKPPVAFGRKYTVQYGFGENKMKRILEQFKGVLLPEEIETIQSWRSELRDRMKKDPSAELESAVGRILLKYNIRTQKRPDKPSHKAPEVPETTPITIDEESPVDFAESGSCVSPIPSTQVIAFSNPQYRQRHHVERDHFDGHYKPRHPPERDHFDDHYKPRHPPERDHFDDSISVQSVPARKPLELSPYRQNLLLRAYRKTNPSFAPVPRSTLMTQCHVECHPEVVAGRIGVMDVLMDMESFFGEEPVTMQRFVDYYDKRSRDIQSDTDFEKMISRLWGLQAGDEMSKTRSDLSVPPRKRLRLHDLTEDSDTTLQDPESLASGGDNCTAKSEPFPHAEVLELITQLQRHVADLAHRIDGVDARHDALTSAVHRCEYACSEMALKARVLREAACKAFGFERSDASTQTIPHSQQTSPLPLRPESVLEAV